MQTTNRNCTASMTDTENSIKVTNTYYLFKPPTKQEAMWTAMQMITMSDITTRSAAEVSALEMTIIFSYRGLKGGTCTASLLSAHLPINAQWPMKRTHANSANPEQTLQHGYEIKTKTCHRIARLTAPWPSHKKL